MIHNRIVRGLVMILVIVLVVITQIIQSFGTWLAAKLDKRLKNK